MQDPEELDRVLKPSNQLRIFGPPCSYLYGSLQLSVRCSTYPIWDINVNRNGG